MKIAQIMSRRPLAVPPGTSLDHAMALMEDHDVRHLPVLAGDRLVGVVSDRDLLEATGWLHPREREVVGAPAGTVGELFRRDVATVGPDEDLGHALGPIVQRRIGCLPVLSDRKLVGIVTEMDLLQSYAHACRLGRIDPADDPPVESFLTRDPQTVGPRASGDEAEALLRSAGIRHLPVVSDGELVGMLSDRDVRRLRGRGQLELTLVEDMMSRDPQTLDLHQHLSSAALLLASARIGALPVVDRDRLVGIVTLIDVAVPCTAALQRLG